MTKMLKNSILLLSVSTLLSPIVDNIRMLFGVTTNACRSGQIMRQGVPLKYSMCL